VIEAESNPVYAFFVKTVEISFTTLYNESSLFI